VQVTEMDVGIPVDKTGAPANPPDLKTQADIYRQVARACVQHRGCTAFLTWGVTDKYTWITGYSKGKKGAPLLFDANYARKPAYQTVLDVFRHAHRRRGTHPRVSANRR
jgi:endo-1,4-beta-xylanase